MHGGLLGDRAEVLDAFVHVIEIKRAVKLENAQFERWQMKRHGNERGFLIRLMRVPEWPSEPSCSSFGCAS